MIHAALTIAMTRRCAGPEIFEAKALISVARSLALALENALTTNNRFVDGCSSWCYHRHCFPPLVRLIQIHEDTVIPCSWNNPSFVVNVPRPQHSTLYGNLADAKGSVNVHDNTFPTSSSVGENVPTPMSLQEYSSVELLGRGEYSSSVITERSQWIT